MQAQTLHFTPPDAAEETARADLYGLLATLFCAPPSAALLTQIGAAPAGGEGVLDLAWAELVTCCKVAGAEAVRDEYELLFLGVGKPEVMLYGSYYLSGFLMEKPLAALRTDLAALGLERSAHIVESEDHIASLCEVMRYLIVCNDPDLSTLESQKKFFSTHLQPWVDDLWLALEQHPACRFFLPVARLGRAFMAVEMQAFDMN